MLNKCKTLTSSVERVFLNFILEWGDVEYKSILVYVWRIETFFALVSRQVVWTGIYHCI